MVVATFVGGLLLSRFLTDRARRDAEEALARSEQHAGALRESQRLLAEERAALAARVEERTAELSAANTRLEQALRLKDEFLAAMSHELRTPLTAILSYSEALQAELYGPLTERQRAALTAVDSGARHLLALINDMLDLARIDAGEMKLQRAPCSVHDVCDASLQLVWHAAQARHLEITTTIDAGATTVEADELRLRQMLVNLLSNAVKFTPPGGRIGLEVRGDRERQTIAFTVWDTGIGIAPEDQARLFQPFVQLDASLARRYEGTGLGLALVAKLAKLHGGEVSLSSAPGAGSRFTLQLPWAAPPPAEPAAGAPLATVLVADDNETSAELMQEYLEAKGYRVLIAHNGAEALELARTARPAVILMDIQMPVMDGLEATRHLRADASTAHIPIVAITAMAAPGDTERYLAAGATAALRKPVRLAELAQTIGMCAARTGLAEGET
ncbi:MAG TPA: ATP-binding protein [Roseiflexaceae bacterium]|nr:ATP-binding protein [Roseiflexaceae bacterium]